MNDARYHHRIDSAATAIAMSQARESYQPFSTDSLGWRADVAEDATVATTGFWAFTVVVVLPSSAAATILLQTFEAVATFWQAIVVR